MIPKKYLANLNIFVDEIREAKGGACHSTHILIRDHNDKTSLRLPIQKM